MEWSTGMKNNLLNFYFTQTCPAAGGSRKEKYTKTQHHFVALQNLALCVKN